MRVIAEKFDVDIVSEHEPEYWGYETEKEWDAAWEAMAEKDERDFYDEMVKFVRGESYDIEPRTIGMTKLKSPSGWWRSPPIFWLKTNDLIRSKQLT